jgi:hypothetical protein
MDAAMTEQPSWPSGPSDGPYTDDHALLDEAPPHAVIGEMAGALRDTRGNMLMDGGVLGAITIGIALEAALSARVLLPGAPGVLNVGLLCGLLLCWLRAITLLALAGRPVLNALSEIRWVTGAPLDPRARWLTLPSEGDSGEWTWIRAHLLLGAARLARYRIQLAVTWTYATAAFFLVWTAIILLGL